MEFSIERSLQILQNTPVTLSTTLSGLDEEWVINSEGENTWNIKEVVAHLLVCEKTNWMPRAKIILAEGFEGQFQPIDMRAHFDLAEAHSLSSLLADFTQMRSQALRELGDLNWSESDLNKTAVHPVLGEIFLRQLMATWVCHDLSHLAQVSRILAKQYKENVGPFITFLKFLNQ